MGSCLQHVQERAPDGRPAVGCEEVLLPVFLCGDTIASWKCRFYLEVAAGIFVDSSRVVDGNLVSGHTYRDNGHFVGPWIRLLEEAAAQIVKEQAEGRVRSRAAGRADSRCPSLI